MLVIEIGKTGKASSLAILVLVDICRKHELRCFSQYYRTFAMFKQFCKKLSLALSLTTHKGLGHLSRDVAYFKTFAKVVWEDQKDGATVWLSIRGFDSTVCMFTYHDGIIDIVSSAVISHLLQYVSISKV